MKRRKYRAEAVVDDFGGDEITIGVNLFANSRRGAMARAIVKAHEKFPRFKLSVRNKWHIEEFDWLGEEESVAKSEARWFVDFSSL